MQRHFQQADAVGKYVKGIRLADWPWVHRCFCDRDIGSVGGDGYWRKPTGSTPLSEVNFLMAMRGEDDAEPLDTCNLSV